MALSVGRSPNNHNAVEIRRPKEELTIRDGRSLQIRTRRDAPSASGSAAGCSTSSRRQQPAVSSWSTRSRQQGYTEAYAFWPRRTPLFRLFLCGEPAVQEGADPFRPSSRSTSARRLRRPRTSRPRDAYGVRAAAPKAPVRVAGGAFFCRRLFRAISRRAARPRRCVRLERDVRLPPRYT